MIFIIIIHIFFFIRHQTLGSAVVAYIQQQMPIHDMPPFSMKMGVV